MNDLLDGKTEYLHNPEEHLKVFKSGCGYIGKRKNMYDKGLRSAFELYNRPRSQTDKVSDAEFYQSDLEQIRQNTLNYMPNYQRDTRKFDAQNPNIDTTVFTYHAEKKTLFNLYAFTYHDSYQKYQKKGEKDDSNSSLDTKLFRIPSLKLKNVEIRNMLNDYQSLIYVEKDNYVI